MLPEATFSRSQVLELINEADTAIAGFRERRHHDQRAFRDPRFVEVTAGLIRRGETLRRCCNLSRQRDQLLVGPVVAQQRQADGQTVDFG